MIALSMRFFKRMRESVKKQPPKRLPFYSFGRLQYVNRNKQHCCYDDEHGENVRDLSADTGEFCVVPTVPSACKGKYESSCDSAPDSFSLIRAFRNEYNRYDTEERSQNECVAYDLIDNAFGRFLCHKVTSYLLIFD